MQHRDIKAKLCSSGNYVAQWIIHSPEKTIFLIGLARTLVKAGNNDALTIVVNSVEYVKEREGGMN